MGSVQSSSRPGGTVGEAVQVHFTSQDPAAVDALQEDLATMSLLLDRSLEQVAGEDSPPRRMGVPMLLESRLRSLGLYLEGFGAVFVAKVGFPLLAPPVTKTEQSGSPSVSDDWTRARHELFGYSERGESERLFATGAAPYSAERVETLKRALLETLKNASNIRRLKAEEAVAVTVLGTESVPTLVAAPNPDLVGADGGLRGAGRSSVLTIRTKKSDAEAFAKGELSFDQFQQRATINTWIGPSTKMVGAESRNPARNIPSVPRAVQYRQLSPLLPPYGPSSRYGQQQ
jgi:hypothetical protein